MTASSEHTLGNDSCIFQETIRILTKGDSQGAKVVSVIGGGVDTVTAGTLFEEAVGSSACKRRAKRFG